MEMSGGWKNGDMSDMVIGLDQRWELVIEIGSFWIFKTLGV
jgi:hypothetical protein